LPLPTYSRLGACRKTRVVRQNRRPDQERTKTWGHDVRVLLSTYGGRGDEPLVGLAVRLRALGAEAPVIRSASAVPRGTAASEVSR
jgi:hypothetical protein